MIKAFLRTYIFVFISIKVSEFIIGGFDFGENYDTNIILLTLAICLLNIFIKPILTIFSLPKKGFSYIFFNFCLTFVLLLLSTGFLKGFGIVETVLPELRIFEYVLPSKELTSLMSAVFTALTISLVFNFMEKICLYK